MAEELRQALATLLGFDQADRPIQTDLDIESRVTVSINKGCGTELNRTALGEFAE